MKIFMVHPHDLFSPVEPWTIRIIKFAEELQKKGHVVRIAYFPLKSAGSKFIHGVEVTPLERRITPITMIKNINYLVLSAQWADIIHFQKSHFYAALPSLLAAYIVGKPVHYDWDDWEEEIFYASVQKKTLTSVLTGFSFYLLERCLPFLVDSVSVSSEELRLLALKRGVNVDRVFWTPVGADLEIFKDEVDAHLIRDRYQLNSDILVMYHGQLHSCQYAIIFLKAIRIISDFPNGDKIKYIIVGDGSQLSMLKKASQELGIENKVIFTGFVAHSDIPFYIAAADICVAPFEDNKVTRCKSPLKIAEYLAAGKAIVASGVGEVNKMVGGVGLIVKSGSPEEMAKGVWELACKKINREAMSMAARQRAESIYNWRFSADNLEKAYRLSVY